MSIKGCNSVAKLQKMTLYNPNIELVNDYVNKNLVKFCLLNFKLLSKNQILTSIKGHNSVANLQKMMLYNPNVYLVNDNIYTKYG